MFFELLHYFHIIVTNKFLCNNRFQFAIEITYAMTASSMNILKDNTYNCKLYIKMYESMKIIEKKNLNYWTKSHK